MIHFWQVFASRCRGVFRKDFVGLGHDRGTSSVVLVHVGKGEECVGQEKATRSECLQLSQYTGAAS